MFDSVEHFVIEYAGTLKSMENHPDYAYCNYGDYVECLRVANKLVNGIMVDKPGHATLNGSKALKKTAKVFGITKTDDLKFHLKRLNCLCCKQGVER